MTDKEKFEKAVGALIKRYENGERRLRYGLCNELASTYFLSSEWSFLLIEIFYHEETKYIEPNTRPCGTLDEEYEAKLPYTLLGPRHHFTKERYDFLVGVRDDIQRGRFNDWPNETCIDYPEEDYDE